MFRSASGLMMCLGPIVPLAQGLAILDAVTTGIVEVIAVSVLDINVVMKQHGPSSTCARHARSVMIQRPGEIMKQVEL